MMDVADPPDAPAVPALSRYSLLRAIQVLGWLFFRPSTWRRAIAGIAPDLTPDFALLDLRPADWHDPALRQVLVAIYGLLPLLVSCATGLLLWSIGAPALDRVEYGAMSGQ